MRKNPKHAKECKTMPCRDGGVLNRKDSCFDFEDISFTCREMMTGQILAGADPMLAVRYQIVVMSMIVAATAISVVAILHIVRGRCFGPAQQLLLRP